MLISVTSLSSSPRRIFSITVRVNRIRRSILFFVFLTSLTNKSSVNSSYRIISNPPSSLPTVKKPIGSCMRDLTKSQHAMPSSQAPTAPVTVLQGRSLKCNSHDSGRGDSIAPVFPWNGPLRLSTESVDDQVRYDPILLI